MHKRPELLIPLGSEVGVVQLMGGAIEAEAHEAQGADNEAVDFVEQSVLAQQTVGRLVKADHHSVHEVAGDQDQRHGEPVVVAIHAKSDGCLRDEKQGREYGEGNAAAPMHFVRLDDGLGG